MIFSSYCENIMPLHQIKHACFIPYLKYALYLYLGSNIISFSSRSYHTSIFRRTYSITISIIEIMMSSIHIILPNIAIKKCNI